METPNIDLKDKRILNKLDKSPNALLNDIAKEVATSKQVIDYRIKKLLSQKTIYDFYTIVNLGKLGYSLFRAHIKLKSSPQERYLAFANEISKRYPTFWIGFVSGSFDLIVDIWAHNISEFGTILSEILKRNQNLVYSYEIFPMLSLHMYSYDYFLNKRQERRKTTIFEFEKNLVKIDEIDLKLLQTIKSNSRMSYEEIGRRIKLTRNAVKNRIKLMEQNKLISDYHIMVNFKHFNRLSYKIFITYDHQSINEEKNLISFIKNQSGILAHAKLLGKWDLDIEIQPKDALELQQFVIELRNKFKIIKDYELIQIIEDYCLDFFPLKTNI